jgi:hypothetical protein
MSLSLTGTIIEETHEVAARHPVRGHNPKLVAAFARAIVRPLGNAGLLAPDNTVKRWIPIADAAHDLYAFTVEVSADILAVDSDDLRLELHIWELAATLRSDGCEPVIVASGQPGRRHLLVRIKDEDLHDKYVVRAKSAGFDVRSSIRPPLSPHRLKLPVELLAPQEPQAALAALGAGAKPLTPRMEALLRYGDHECRYASSGGQSSVFFAVVMSMVNARWARRDAFSTLYDRNNTGGAKIHLRGNRAAWNYFVATWQKATEIVSMQPAARDRADVERLIVAVETATGAAALSGTDRRVLQAHIRISRKSGKVVYHASVRSIAELAGLGCWETVVKSHRRLRHAGWLKLVKRWSWTTGRPIEWTLRVPAGVEKQNTRISSTPQEGVENRNTPTFPSGGDARECSVPAPVTGTPNMDVFRRGGFGGDAYLTWEQLCAFGAQKSGEIAKRIGRKSKTVRRHLQRFVAYGMAVHDSAWRWSPIPGVDLAFVAHQLGVSGKAKAQRTRHDRERDHFDDELCRRGLRRSARPRPDRR